MYTEYKYGEVERSTAKNVNKNIISGNKEMTNNCTQH